MHLQARYKQKFAYYQSCNIQKLQKWSNLQRDSKQHCMAYYWMSYSI